MSDKPSKEKSINRSTKVVSVRVKKEFHAKLMGKLQENGDELADIVVPALEAYVGESARAKSTTDLETLIREQQQALEALQQEVASLKREPATIAA